MKVDGNMKYTPNYARLWLSEHIPEFRHVWAKAPALDKLLPKAMRPRAGVGYLTVMVPYTDLFKFKFNRGEKLIDALHEHATYLYNERTRAEHEFPKSSTRIEFGEQFIRVLFLEEAEDE